MTEQQHEEEDGSLHIIGTNTDTDINSNTVLNYTSTCGRRYPPRTKTADARSLMMFYNVFVFAVFLVSLHGD